MAAKLETISGMEAYFRGMKRCGMDWNTKISPRLTDVKVHIMSSRYVVPESKVDFETI
jgi:hypothetical protein